MSDECICRGSQDAWRQYDPVPEGASAVGRGLMGRVITHKPKRQGSAEVTLLSASDCSLLHRVL